MQRRFRFPSLTIGGSTLLAQRASVLWAFCALAFILFFRPTWAMRIDGTHDAPCYMEWLYRFLDLRFDKCFLDSYLPGTSLTWLPAGISATWLAWFTESNLDEWIISLVGATSFLSWCASLFLIDRILRHREPRISPLWSIGVLMCVPALYYGLMRTTMSHAAELVLALLLVDAIQRSRLWAALVFALWLSVTRVNDAPALLLCVGALVDKAARNADQTRKISRSLLLASFVGVAIGALLLLRVGFLSGYNDVYLDLVLRFLTWDRTRHVLVGSDWGLAWTAPAWCLVLAVGLFYFRNLSWAGRAAWLWMAANLLLCIGWRGNGSDFAYRYLIGSYAGALLVWNDLKDQVPSLLRYAQSSILPWNAAWMTLLAWVYRLDDTVRPIVYVYYWGRLVPQFQKKALVMLADPSALIRALGLSPLVTLPCSWRETKHCAEWGAEILAGPRLWTLTAMAAVAALILLTHAARRLATRASDDMVS